MNTHKDLTHAEVECLAHLAEEANELAKACMKLIRHGKTAIDESPLSKGRDVLYDNAADVLKEVLDVRVATNHAIFLGVLPEWERYPGAHQEIVGSKLASMARCIHESDIGAFRDWLRQRGGVE